jgi:hypothetical protein
MTDLITRYRRAFHITRKEALALDILVRQERVTYLEMAERLYGTPPRLRWGSGNPHNVLKVYLSHLRAALPGVAIDSLLRVGWQIAPESKSRIEQLLQQKEFENAA